MGAQETIDPVFSTLLLVFGLSGIMFGVGKIVSNMQALTGTLTSTSEAFLIAASLSITNAYPRAEFKIDAPPEKRMLYIRNLVEFFYFSNATVNYIPLIFYKQRKVIETNSSELVLLQTLRGDIMKVVKEK